MNMTNREISSDQILKPTKTIQLFGKGTVRQQQQCLQNAATVTRESKFFWEKKVFEEQQTAKIQNFEFHLMNKNNSNKRESQEMYSQPPGDSKMSTLIEENSTTFQNNILRMILQLKTQSNGFNSQKQSEQQPVYTYMNIMKLPHDWNDNYYQVCSKEKHLNKIKQSGETKSKRKNYEVDLKSEMLLQEKKEKALQRKDSMKQKLNRLESKDRKNYHEQIPLKPFYGQVAFEKPLKQNVLHNEFDAFEIENPYNEEELFHSYVQNAKDF